MGLSDRARAVWGRLRSAEPEQWIPFEEAFDDQPATRFYGDGTTLHSSGEIDVVTYRGEVIEVWFRCQPLPFKQIRETDKNSARLVKETGFPLPQIVGLFLIDPE